MNQNKPKTLLDIYDNLNVEIEKLKAIAGLLTLSDGNYDQGISYILSEMYTHLKLNLNAFVTLMTSSDKVSEPD